ncbi:hypothetical protein HY345_01470 [Candidatus Microgenomates bacterium]|nr:hypothetical protein [Candidatus Microgenomates bacterium]
MFNFSVLTNPTVSLIFFGLGVAIAALRRIKTKDGLTGFIACIGASLLLITLLAIEDTNRNDLALIAYGYFFCFLIVFTTTTFLAKEILHSVSELDVLIYTILFWFITITKFSPLNWPTSGELFALMFFIILVGFSLTVLFSSVVNSVNGAVTEIALYVWFIFINIFLFFTLIGPEIFNVRELSRNYPSPFSSFLNGFVFFGIASNICLLYNLLPIPGKGQEFGEKLNQIKGLLEVIKLKFKDKQARPLFSLLVIVTLSFILMSNYSYQLVGYNDLLFVILILSPIISGFSLLYFPGKLHR